MLFDPQQDTIARPHPYFVDAWRDWQLCDDLDGGVERMRWAALSCSERWLPKEYGEEAQQYRTRVERSDLYPGYSQGLDDAIARPFAKPVQVDELPTDWKPWTWDIDGSGNDLTQFLSHFMRCAVKHGMAHILADFTNQGGGTISRAVEDRLKPRPWWRLVPATALVNWKSETLPSGKHVLTEARIHEITTVPDGNYGEKPVELIRVIRRDSFEVWQNKAYDPPRTYGTERLDLDARYYNAKPMRTQDWVKIDEGSFGPQGGFESVPIVTAYTGYIDFMRARPPFMALAEANVTHWRKKSDYDNLAHYAGVPIMFARGMGDDDMKGAAIGAGTVIRSQDPDASLTFVEHSGSALMTLAEDLDRLERRMEQLGVRPHVERMQGATATGIAVNSSSADTDVQAWAQSIDTAAEQAFDWSARWAGVESPEDLDVQIYKDFAIEMIGGGDVPALQADVDSGRVRVETYLREMKRRGIYADTLEVEEEVAHAEQEKQRKAEIAASIGGGKPSDDAEEDTDESGGMPDDSDQREAE